MCQKIQNRFFSESTYELKKQIVLKNDVSIDFYLKKVDVKYLQP